MSGLGQVSLTQPTYRRIVARSRSVPQPDIRLTSTTDIGWNGIRAGFHALYRPGRQHSPRRSGVQSVSLGLTVGRHWDPHRRLAAKLHSLQDCLVGHVKRLQINVVIVLTLEYV